MRLTAFILALLITLAGALPADANGKRLARFDDLSAGEPLARSRTDAAETAFAALDDWHAWWARRNRLAPQGESPRRTLWRIEEFAAAHGISKRQAYKLLERGALKGVRVGRRTLITDASRRRWLARLPD